MSPVPIRPMVYILVEVQIIDGMPSTAIGEAHTDRLEARQAAQRLRKPGVVVNVVERELHGPIFVSVQP